MVRIPPKIRTVAVKSDAEKVIACNHPPESVSFGFVMKKGDINKRDLPGDIRLSNIIVVNNLTYVWTETREEMDFYK